jgi:hypothetical protein
MMMFCNSVALTRATICCCMTSGAPICWRSAISSITAHKDRRPALQQHALSVQPGGGDQRFELQVSEAEGG